MEPTARKTDLSYQEPIDRPAGCSFGRIFKKVATGVWNVAKVALVASLCLLPSVALGGSFTSLADYYMNGKVMVRNGFMLPGLYT